MSADESALLAAVAADSASDLPRLVYADWLDDHGQPLRAEFIRLQCEIARLEVGPRAVVDVNWRLWKRQQDLLDDHLSEVLGPAAFLAQDRPVCQRGFVTEVTQHLRRFLDTDAASAALTPLPNVRVYCLEGLYDRFFASDHLDLVTEIAVYDEEASDNEPEMLLPERFNLLARRFARLEHLDFDSCGLTDISSHELADADFQSLRRLNLSNCYLTDVGVIRILDAPYIRRLTDLSLDGNPFTDQSAFELADRLAPVKSFRTLDFRRTHVTSAGQAALTAAFGSRCNLF